MGSIEDLKNILKNSKNSSNDSNLYDHLTDTFVKILLDKSATSFDNFEKFSNDIKETPLRVEKKNPYTIESDDTKNIKLNWTSKVSSLLAIPTEPLALEIECPDLVDESNILEWANFSIGKSDVYKLNLSIRSFAATLSSDVTKLRFFGKFSTKSLPYYVIEGLAIDDDFSDEMDEKLQEGRAGVNKYTYWISQTVTAKPTEWVKLPIITMEHIVLARLNNRILTGNLEASAPSFPPFPGTEKHFLRAKIAVILGATAISPEGFYDLDEDGDIPVAKLADAESLMEKTPKIASDLKSAENWKHHELEINEIGRITALPESEDEEELPTDNEIIPAEIPVPLADIKSEKWSFRVCPGGAGENDASYVVAKNLEWPGAVTVANGKKFVNAYFGYGLKFNNKPFVPLLPANIENEIEPNKETVDVITDPTPLPEPTPADGEEGVDGIDGEGVDEEES